MKIYVAHSNKSDYQNELYQPLRNSSLNAEHEITLPHENSTELFNSKEYLKTCDLVIAEVTLPATGLGIELGWANLYEIPIVCIHKTEANTSSSLKAISDVFIEYSDSAEMISKLTDYIQSHE